MHHIFLALVNTIMTNEKISMAKSGKGSYILAVVCNKVILSLFSFNCSLYKFLKKDNPTSLNQFVPNK